MFISTFVPLLNIRSARRGAKYWAYKGEGHCFLALQEPSGGAEGVGAWWGWTEHLPQAELPRGGD